MKGWGGHMILVLLMAGVCARAAWLHPSGKELATRLAPLLDPDGQTGDTMDDSARTVTALHKLLNREETLSREAGQRLTETLLASDDSLLQDFALTTDLCQLSFHTPENVPRTQEAWVLGRTPLPLDGPWWRQFILYQRKVGGKQVGGRKRLNSQELLWYRQALRGEHPPKERLFEHLLQRSGAFHEGPIPRGQ